MEFVEVKFTTDNEKEAKKIIEKLLDEKLVACGQIFHIESHYVWKKERFITPESMVLMKTKRSLFQEIEKVIKDNHSYEVAEIIAQPINEISEEYQKWIEENTI